MKLGTEREISFTHGTNKSTAFTAFTRWFHLSLWHLATNWTVPVIVDLDKVDHHLHGLKLSGPPNPKGINDLSLFLKAKTSYPSVADPGQLDSNPQPCCQHTECPGSSYPNLYDELLYKMGYYFLDIWYMLFWNVIMKFEKCLVIQWLNDKHVHREALFKVNLSSKKRSNDQSFIVWVWGQNA